MVERKKAMLRTKRFQKIVCKQKSRVWSDYSKQTVCVNNFPTSNAVYHQQCSFSSGQQMVHTHVQTNRHHKETKTGRPEQEVKATAFEIQ